METQRIRSLMGGAAMAAVAMGLYGAPQAALAQETAEEASDRVVVTGSRIARTGFDMPTPVTTISSDYLENQSYVDVGQAVNDLPAFKASLTPETNGWGSFNVGAQRANLRALGPTRGLVLVDGRRFVPSTNQGDVDMSLVPSIMTDRVEVVTGGASAAYGSDALAGVVNIILDTDMEGLRVDLDYGQSIEGDGKDYHAAAAWGSGFAAGRGHFIVGGEYQDAKGIGTCFTRDHCDDLPGVVTNVLNGVGGGNGQPRYIRTTGVVLASATPNGIILGQPNPTPGAQPIPFATGTPLAGPAAGQLWQFNDGGDGLIPYQTGQYATFLQEGGDGESLYRTTNIRVPYERYSAFAHADFELTPRVNLFVEGSYGHTEGSNLGAATWWTGANSIPVQRDNPFLPAEAAALMDAQGVSSIAVGAYGLDIGRVISTSVNETYRVVGGLQGELSDTWTWDAYYQYGHNERDQSVALDRINTNFAWASDVTTDGSGEPVCRILTMPNPPAAAAGCVPFNIFGSGNFSDAAVDYAFGTIQEYFEFDQHVFAANTQGEVFDLPAGPFAVAAGAEYRYEEGAVTHDANARTFNYWLNYGDDYAGSVKVIEGYLEANAPLLRDRPGANLLELNAAGRQTKYTKENAVTGVETEIDATTWKLGLIYEPVDWLRFRGTRSRDIRAPNFQELYSRNQSQLGTVTNPFLTPPQGQNPVTETGGNVNLDAEKGDTYTVGLVLTPSVGWLQGFRFSADYWDITIEDAIGTTGSQTIVDNCFQGIGDFCQYLTFDASQNITAVRNVNFNLNSFELSGIDFEAMYNFDALGGNMTARILATHTMHLIQDTGVEIDYAGQTGSVSGGPGVPDWLANLSLTYARDKWGVTAAGRYISEGIYSATYIGPDDPAYDVTLPNSVNDNTVESRFYVDLNVRYDVLETSDGRNLQLFGSVSNLLDTGPPIAPYTFYPTNPDYFDQVGTTFRIGLRYRG